MADSDAAPNLRRRTLLRRLGLGLAMAYAAPVVVSLSAARASDSVSAPSYSSSSSQSSGPSRPAAQPQQRASTPRHQPPPELVVAVAAPAEFAALQAGGFRLIASEPVALLGRWVGRFAAPRGLTLEEARRRAIELAPGGQVEPNDLYRPSEMLCTAGECTAFSLVGWPQAAPCAADPAVGMIDTAINTEHDAFAGRALTVVTLDSAERRQAARTHGTAVAALLIGRSDSRTPGLLPEARLVAVNAFHADGEGDAADAYSLLRAMDRLAEARVEIINMSFAGPHNPLVETAVAALHEGGLVLVAAAGNDGPRAGPRYPAAYAQVVAVTAVDSGGRIYRHAVTGPHIGFAAPGVRLWTAASVLGGRLRSGTSYAAPFVTAALAVAGQAHPELEAEALVALLARRARDLGEAGFDPVFGWGMLRADELCLVPA